MARFISVEIDASQLRVAEIEEVGRKERILQCFSIPMPQGMTEDGEVRDTKNLAELLVQGLEAHAIKSKRFILWRVLHVLPVADIRFRW